MYCIDTYTDTNTQQPEPGAGAGARGSLLHGVPTSTAAESSGACTLLPNLVAGEIVPSRGTR